MVKKTVEIYVQIIDFDEYGTYRATQAIDMGNGLYKVLPIKNYETADETWEFVPGTVVKVERKKFNYKDGYYLAAIARVG